LNTRALGTSGESAASRFLEKKGYKVIERNFQCKSGEIDIIAMEGETLCFVEVKTRSNISYGPPYLSVTPQKQHQLSLVALNYLAKTKRKFSGIRFDVVSIDRDKIELFKGAFEGTL
jgi:putative endonuclease